MTPEELSQPIERLQALMRSGYRLTVLSLLVPALKGSLLGCLEHLVEAGALTAKDLHRITCINKNRAYFFGIKLFVY